MKIKPSWNLKDGVVPYGGRFALPRKYRIEINDPSRPYIVALEVVTERGGRPECESVQCQRRPDGPPVTGEGLRRLPIAGFIRHTMQDVALVHIGGGRYRRMGSHAEVEDLFAAHRRGPGKRGRQPVTDERLRQVAETYRDAMSRGRPPTMAVALLSDPEIGRAQAARLVRRARDRGFLGRSIPGKAGEASQQTRRRRKHGSH